MCLLVSDIGSFQIFLPLCVWGLETLQRCLCVLISWRSLLQTFRRCTALVWFLNPLAPGSDIKIHFSWETWLGCSTASAGTWWTKTRFWRWPGRGRRRWSPDFSVMLTRPRCGRWRWSLGSAQNTISAPQCLAVVLSFLLWAYFVRGLGLSS